MAGKDLARIRVVACKVCSDLGQFRLWRWAGHRISRVSKIPVRS